MSAAARAPIPACAVMLGLLFAVQPAYAQDSADTDAGRLSFTASLLTWSAPWAQPDPEVYRLNSTNFVGSVEWPAVGGLAGGGVRMTRRFSIGADLTWRSVRTAEIRELSRSRNELLDLSSRLAYREHVVAFPVRLHLPVRGRMEIQPIAGLSIARNTRSLKDRHGTSMSSVGPLSVTRPDTEVRSTNGGAIVGAELVIGPHGPAALVTGVRLQMFPRGVPRNYQRTAPDADRFILQVSAGVQVVTRTLRR